MYNVDDLSFAFVNQHYINYQSRLTDSGFIDVAPYTQNGLNSFTFLTYNGANPYNWGFQIIKDGNIDFDDMGGLLGVISANNMQSSTQNQFVYNKTIFVNLTKCPLVTTISSKLL